MKSPRLIRRIAVAVVLFAIFLVSALGLARTHRELELQVWPIDHLAEGKLMLGVDDPQVDELMKLFVVARSDERRFRGRDRDDVFGDDQVFRIGVSREEGTDEVSTLWCDAERIRRPADYRGALRCDLSTPLRPQERTRLIVGGTAADAPRGVRYELVAIPVRYLKDRESGLLAAWVSGILYLLASLRVLNEVRRLQKANAASSP